MSIGKSRLTYICLSVALVCCFTVIRPESSTADGVHVIPLPVSQGCFGLDSYGIPMFGTGSGSVTVNPPGSILGVYIHWVGAEDNTPNTTGTSTLTINGVDVTGWIAIERD
ncbi:hypothetical protein ACFLU6_06840 [Acidobacteriota bacterium]